MSRRRPRRCRGCCERSGARTSTTRSTPCPRCSTLSLARTGAAWAATPAGLPYWRFAAPSSSSPSPPSCRATAAAPPMPPPPAWRCGRSSRRPFPGSSSGSAREPAAGRGRMSHPGPRESARRSGRVPGQSWGRSTRRRFPHTRGRCGSSQSRGTGGWRSCLPTTTRAPSSPQSAPPPLARASSWVACTAPSTWPEQTHPGRSP
mmetsp:Transcript_266/g.783  ORF Transcript_266/g.783 Transcript_266/m.783 type:complete len:204 (+) Transcript_266:98-709(+)